MRKLGRLIWAAVPTWWTLGKTAYAGAWLWSLSILIDSDLGGGAGVVGLTFMAAGVLGLLAIDLLEQQAEENEVRRRMTEADRVRRAWEAEGSGLSLAEYKAKGDTQTASVTDELGDLAEFTRPLGQRDPSPRD